MVLLKAHHGLASQLEHRCCGSNGLGCLEVALQQFYGVGYLRNSYYAAGHGVLVNIGTYARVWLARREALFPYGTVCMTVFRFCRDMY